MSDDGGRPSWITRLLPTGRLSFGLREAIVVAIVGVAITIAAAIHYGT